MELAGVVLSFLGALVGGVVAARWSYRRTRLDDLLHAAPEYAAVLRRIGKAEIATQQMAGDPEFSTWQQRMAPHLVDLPAELRESFTHPNLASTFPVDHGAHLVATADRLDAFVTAEAAYRDRWSPSRRARARRLRRAVRKTSDSG